MIGILSTVAILMASTSTNGVFTWWDQGAKLAQIYGAYVWAYLLLVLAMILLLKHGSETEPSMQLMAFRVQVSDFGHRSALAPEHEPINPAVGSPALIPRSAQENPLG